MHTAPRGCPGTDPHPRRARRLGGVCMPWSPLPWSHLLSLRPVVTHCSPLRLAGLGLWAMLGSTLRQYSVTQNSSLSVNSVLFFTTVICKGQHRLAPERSCFPPSSSSSAVPWQKSPGCAVITMTAARSKIYKSCRSLPKTMPRSLSVRLWLRESPAFTPTEGCALTICFST